MKKSLLIAAALTGAILTACTPKAQPEETAPESSKAEESAESAEIIIESSEAAEETEGEETEPQQEADKETELLERKILHPVVEEQRFSDYSEYGEYGDGYQLFCSGKVSTVGIREEEYPQLKKALSEFSEAKKEAVESEYHTLSEIAREEFSFRQSEGGEFYPYSTESVINVLRADDRVFSFINENYGFSGGVHGSSSVSGYNYDSQTGKLLTLSDVISNREGLYEEIVARLTEEYQEEALFPEYKETVRQEVYEEPSGLANYNYSLNFTLTTQGMTVYFSPYEIGPWASGTMKVEIPYDSEKAGFNQQYVCSYDAGVHRLKEYESLSIDIDGDGGPEEVSYVPASTDGMVALYTLTADGAEMTLDGYYGISAAYIMQGEDGVYFYGECLSDNDYRYLAIVNLTSLAEGSPETGTCYSGFYDSVPMDVQNFELFDRGDLLSTALIARNYQIGQGGQPLPLEEEYRVMGRTLTAIAEIPAFTGSNFEEETVIPTGTKLYWTATDNKTYGILENAADGSKYKVLVDISGWPRTIEGKSIEECFEGLVFAG